MSDNPPMSADYPMAESGDDHRRSGQAAGQLCC